MNQFLRILIINLALFFGLVVSVFFLFFLFQISVPLAFYENHFLLNGKSIIFEISKVAKNVSNHSYAENIYDCTEFSKDLVKQLSGSGIASYCVSGFYINESNVSFRHTWVELKIDNETIDIEATRGLFIPKENYSRLYRSTSKGFCL